MAGEGKLPRFDERVLVVTSEERHDKFGISPELDGHHSLICFALFNGFALL